MFAWIEDHPATISLMTAFLSLVVSAAALYISLTQQPEEPTSIIKVVEDEARLVRQNDIENLLQLYTEDAVIRDVGFEGSSTKQRPPQFWIGKEEIRKRYEMIRDHAQFPQLEHIGIRVFFDPAGHAAGAISSTQGRFHWDKGEEQIITTVNGESWSFVKLGHQWKIKDVSFHAPPSK